MRKLITGGNGFIGSHLSGDIRPSSRSLNLLHFQQTIEYFKNNDFTSVVHCAANISSAVKMKENHHRYLIENLSMDINVLEAARISGVRNLIALGSISGLKANSDGFIDETCFDLAPSSTVNYGYNVEKYFQPYLMRAYQMDFELNYKSILLSNCYGPGSVIAEDAPLVSSLVSRILRARELDVDLTLYGTGEDLRNLTYVGDLDNIVIQHLGNTENIDPLIIASPYVLKIRDITEMIARILNFDRRIIFEDYSTNSTVNNKICKNDKLMEIGYQIDWTPPEQGLELSLRELI